jgi:hypothetical protein
MGHASVDNLTPFAFGSSFAMDEDGGPLFLPILMATFRFSASCVAVAEVPIPVNHGGEFWGEPGISSYKYEPQTAFMKPATDIVLIGHAYPLASTATESAVRLCVGSLEKTVRVIGDRYWVKTFGTISMTFPEPFERIPLIYENAFGGWDRRHIDPDEHRFDPRNPVGIGFRSKHGQFEEGVRLPNLEDPRYPISNYDDTPPPAGFGFISPEWQPRASFAGTYDETWMKERMPLLPNDFDRRFFNAASSGLVAPGYLRGDEPVLIENASPHGTLSFNLPGVPPPQCRVQLVGRQDAQIPMLLDTVTINTDEDLLLLLWRGYLPVQNGPHDVVSIKISSEGVNTPTAEG